MTGSHTQGIKTVLHSVSDLARAKEVFAALLGVRPQTDDSYYLGFEAAGQHIGLVPGGGPQGMTSPVAYWHIPDRGLMRDGRWAEQNENRTHRSNLVRSKPGDVDGDREGGSALQMETR